MSDSSRKPLYNFYVDDSGTRHPDKGPPTSANGDWFALGGILVTSEQEADARELHRLFCEKWDIGYPLHSVKIRHKTGKFAWIASLSARDARSFYKDLDELIIDLPVVGHACVIDRPGYHQRYFEKYGSERWHLCKTAFSVLCERVAKIAAKDDRRVEVYVEASDKAADGRIRQYFKEMRAGGMPFAQDSSSKYGPMPAEELKYRLIDLNFKKKSSAMMQIADLYLYPMCRSGYDQLYRPLKLMRAHKKIIDQILDGAEIQSMGLKYSCFDQPKNKKGPCGPSLSASKSETS